jgi:dihydroorotase
MMPNLQPPVTTTKLALEYKARIVEALKKNGQDPSKFQPLMTLYLTDKTEPEEIVTASSLRNDDGTPTVVGCKYYPAGATTNSEFGVTDVKNLYPVLEKMQEVGMMLCIHSEVTHADIFEREPIFIEEIMKPLVRDFPTLKITMEHISTKESVDYVLSCPDNVKASITCHHLIYNRNRTYHMHCLFSEGECSSMSRLTDGTQHSYSLSLQINQTCWWEAFDPTCTVFRFSKAKSIVRPW